LNTIADYVSTALIDGEITAQEFKLVLDIMSKYQQMKKEIRDGAQTAHAAVELDEETKNSLIKQDRKEARASFIKSSPFQILRLPELRMFPHGVLLCGLQRRHPTWYKPILCS